MDQTPLNAVDSDAPGSNQLDVAGFRVETDSLGSLPVPATAYWGIHTARALENFAISDRPISVYPDLVHALGAVKRATARTHAEIGTMDAEKALLIETAADEVRRGLWDEQFVVDIVQGGAGTSTNMNANEVIANRALEIAGHARGDYSRIHPIDDVNRGQSTNDVYPTALKIALCTGIARLIGELDALGLAFKAKGQEFWDVVKIGRTQLQDAVPMTLGQEFTGFSVTIAEDCLRLAETIPLLCEINLGATAIGTGITAHPLYAAAVSRHLREITGLPITTATDLVEATSDTGVYMTVSGVLKRSAIKLSKICNDLRLLSSGPQAGFAEITLPPRQAGSSIMPGKVNPVIPEVVNQVAFSIAGNDVTVTLAAEGGQLQLNAFEPIMAQALLQNLRWLGNACRALRLYCVEGIGANRDRLASAAHVSVSVVTALAPAIGYHMAATLAKQALASGRPVAELAVEAGLLSEENVNQYLMIDALTGRRRDGQVTTTQGSE
ncbi:aspartate ammonia-lyase [Dactylosporangium sp. NPDC000555]|uniref:aspartate ammonia-lyase n=1 Tax=Dactylosporangium sp. NPDC000555 TaxID=3154260 RepID=UPI00332B1188